LIDAVENGDVDIAIAWGPFAGFFAQDEKFPLVIVPVSPTTFLGIPFSYGISAAVRVGNQELKAELDGILRAHSGEIQHIIAHYAVPEVNP
jgi:mxaJ protein